MQRARAEQLKEGMIVASDVKNIDGMLLVSTGTILTPRQIGILQTWGIAEVEIENTGEAQGDTDPLSLLPPGKLEQITAELKARFWQADTLSPLQLEIYNLMLYRQARRATSA